MHILGVRGWLGGWPQHCRREEDPAAGDGRGDGERKVIAGGQCGRYDLPFGEKGVRTCRGQGVQDGETECAPDLRPGGEQAGDPNIGATIRTWQRLAPDRVRDPKTRSGSSGSHPVA